jgi:hypothetical protein
MFFRRHCSPAPTLNQARQPWVLLPQAVAQQQLAQRHCQNQRRLSVGRCHQQAAGPVPELQSPEAQLALALLQPEPGPAPEPAPTSSTGAR